MRKATSNQSKGTRVWRWLAGTSLAVRIVTQPAGTVMITNVMR